MNVKVSPSRVTSLVAFPAGAAVGIIAYAASAHGEINALGATSAVTAIAAFAALGLALRR
ncbi:MAG TPA: hypothetical protein VGH94_14180 [Acidimicrobiales bacterium]